MEMQLKLDPRIDVEAARRAYKQRRRVRIEPFLEPEAAKALRQHLLQRDDWLLRMKGEGSKVYQFESKALSSWEPRQVEALRRIAAPITDGTFTYLYESILVCDEHNRARMPESPISELGNFLCSEQVIDLIASITGERSIAFADSFASRYGPGDFLTKHHDKKPGSNRLAAYVLGLTEGWRPEWGGLLLFHDASGDVEDGVSPAFNVLNLFGVPQDHSVSSVVPYAPIPRLSVTGWFRSQPHVGTRA
jgi:Rps23 Pro-64 3,4-dihydroxylase Tpa1-like proline 4-hydroxylase